MNIGAAAALFQKRMGGEYSAVRMQEEILHAQNEILCLREIDLAKRATRTYLETTDNVFQYTVTGRLVTRLYSLDTSGYNRTVPDGYPSEAIIPAGGGGYRRVGNEWSGEEDYAFSCLESFDPDTNECVISFDESFNPGTTVSHYIMEIYDWPEQPVDSGVELALPQQWVTSALYYAVKKRMQEGYYGHDIYDGPEFQALVGRLNAKQANSNKSREAVRQQRF